MRSRLEDRKDVQARLNPAVGARPAAHTRATAPLHSDGSACTRVVCRYRQADGTSKQRSAQRLCRLVMQLLRPAEEPSLARPYDRGLCALGHAPRGKWACGRPPAPSAEWPVTTSGWCAPLLLPRPTVPHHAHDWTASARQRYPWRQATNRRSAAGCGEGLNG